MLTKCIGIISWFPKDDRRSERKRRFDNLIKTLDKYFKLPIIIIAQDWREEDLHINYSNKITIYQYKKLGITKARIKLREKLLNTDFDYFILLDDDSVIECTEAGVKQYLNEIDIHPDMFGKLCNWFRLYAISKYIMERTNFDYIANLDACNGDIWEDQAWMNVWETIYRDRFFRFTGAQIKDVFTPSEFDKYSTWWHEFKIPDKVYRTKTTEVVQKWLKHEKAK